MVFKKGDTVLTTFFDTRTVPIVSLFEFLEKRSLTPKLLIVFDCTIDPSTKKQTEHVTKMQSKLLIPLLKRHKLEYMYILSSSFILYGRLIFYLKLFRSYTLNCISLNRISKEYKILTSSWISEKKNNFWLLLPIFMSQNHSI